MAWARSSSHLFHSQMKKVGTPATAVFKSPLGWIEIAATSKGICGVTFVRSARRGVSRYAPTKNVERLLKKAISELRNFFSGRRHAFSVPLDLVGTAFQKRVWRALRRVPFGKVVTYGELAVRAGFPHSARAVGSAMRQNPLCIIVPCHRVVPSVPRGAIGKYSAGVAKKKWLLKHEKKFDF